MSSDLRKGVKQNQSFDSMYRQLDKNRAESVIERIHSEKQYDEWIKKKDYSRQKLVHSMCMDDIVNNKLIKLKRKFLYDDFNSEIEIPYYDQQSACIVDINDQQNRFTLTQKAVQKAWDENCNMDFEGDIKYDQYSTCVDIENNCKDIFRTVFYFTNKNCKVKHISNTKSKLLENEICGICLDKHPVKDLIVTNCNHVMGKTCFEDVCRSIHIGNEITPCPFCRQNVTQVWVYRKK